MKSSSFKFWFTIAMLSVLLAAIIVLALGCSAENTAKETAFRQALAKSPKGTAVDPAFKIEESRYDGVGPVLARPRGGL